MRTLHVMQAKSEYRRGARVVARTVEDWNRVKSFVKPPTKWSQKLSDPNTGTIQRELSPQDLHEIEKLQMTSRQEYNTCRRIIEQLGLEMDLIDVEIVFGGERVVVYYLAENRIDFRELVKLLTAEFQTRSKCGKWARVMKPNCWPTMVTVENRFVATPISKKCRLSPCEWPSCRSRPSIPTKSLDVAVD